MRVLHVYRRYFPDAPGGTAEAIRQIALVLQAKGVESRVFALSPARETDPVERPEGRVVRSRSWLAPASCDLGGVAALLRFRREANRADLIHYHFPWPFADLLHFSTRPEKPSLITYHADVVEKGVLGRCYRPLQTRMLASMQAVVATSPAYRQTSPALRRVEASSPGRVEVIPLGVSESSYQDHLDAAGEISVTESFGLTPDRYFLFIGAARAYKALPVLEKAAGGGMLPVAVAGPGTSPEGGALHADGDADLKYLGQVSPAQKMALIRNCRALVLPSNRRSEAFGMVLVEAAMCGRPLISTELGTGTSYVNINGETGLVVPPDDPGRLRDAMERLASNDEESGRMGSAARQRYERLFAGRPLAEAYHDLYQRILANHDSHGIQE
ncbi:glycosyltransferase [Spiribacter insolitus]|uniref:Glycosyltransferase n=1 Tax=Spiribacter insolitus TaxID=3122417 RepID=A0ABV3T8P0_9GAMM